jgi:DNA-binding transcriptional MerR regulator
MAEKFTIGELAKAAGVPTSTIRYYERANLLRPSGRTASNYRLYSAEDLERLCFIRAAQSTGFTLEHVVKLLRPAPCGKVQGLRGRRAGRCRAHWLGLAKTRLVDEPAAFEPSCAVFRSTGRCLPRR